MTDTDTRNYDANEFDFENEEDVVQEQCAVEEVEGLLRSALAVTTPVEHSWLRPSKVDEDRARVAYNVPYAMTSMQKTYMSELVGDVRTLTYNAREYHDHPVSHCLTEISEQMVVDKFGNEPFVSIWGNAGRHRRLGHVNAKVVTSRKVPHDWFRNRGMEAATTDVAAFVEGRGHLRYRLFLSTHALYYMSLDDVACWLGGNPDSEFHAIVHRHDKTYGHINKGEIKYTVDSTGLVTQVNPLTGHKYKHKSLEPLFHVDSCRVLDGRVGLTWDINKLAGDNYIIKFVLCDPAGCGSLQDPWELVKKDREVFIRGDVTVYRCLGWEWFVYHASEGQVWLEDAELYDRLRRQIAGKERTPRAKQELMQLCRRLANKADVISIHQGFTHEVPPERMTDYVNAAFYADVKHELEAALLYHKENSKAVDTLNNYIAKGAIPMDATVLGSIGRAVVAPFNTLTGLITEQSYDPEILGDPFAPFIEFIKPPDIFKVRGLSRDEQLNDMVARLRAPAAPV